MGFVGIVDFKSNNASSVLHVVTSLGFEARLVKNAIEIKNANQLIIPGVGHIDSIVTEMDELKIRESLIQFAQSGRNLLGICLGQHLLGISSEESIRAETLRILNFEVNKIPSDAGVGLRVPHVGWNSVKFMSDSRIFEGIPDESDFYFSHSYGIISRTNQTLAITEHSTLFTSVAGMDNIYSVQFHPEKSQKVGRKLLQNFCDL